MNTPMAKHTAATPAGVRILVRWLPLCSPMGIMAISAPRLKNPIPTIKSTAPTRNISRVASDMGVMVTQSTNTISVTGSTASSASIIFSFSFLFKMPPSIETHKAGPARRGDMAYQDTRTCAAVCALCMRIPFTEKVPAGRRSGPPACVLGRHKKAAGPGTAHGPPFRSLVIIIAKRVAPGQPVFWQHGMHGRCGHAGEAG